MTALPIDSSLPEIISRVREARALVLVAPPGAGKTTRVPPALLRAGLLAPQHPNLVMLQPRRVAARAAAQRIADENGWELGREVGYHVRFDRKLGPATRLRVLTEGILTRQLLSDPFLEGVGAVLLDEFHERSLHTDIAAALLREVRQTVREDLILVVMSATLDAEPVAAFLGGCPIVQAHGRAFAVKVTHVPFGSAAIPQRVAEAAHDLFEQGDSATAPAERPGDVLIFLPGVEEIRRTARLLEGLADRKRLLVLPLHGSMPMEEQARVLRPADRRKLILATNIAETSLTIDGVTTVIDSGFARVAGYDPQRGLDRLQLQRISKASAAQRAGRAGRTAPGTCVRLWSQREHAELADFDVPEVRRVDLCGTVLALHAWGKPDPRRFGWYEPPAEQTLAAAERLLAMLGALSSESAGLITPLGREMLALPVHPRLARLLVAAAECGLAHEGAALAALLSEKDIFISGLPANAETRRQTVQGTSDLLVRLDLLQQSERDRFAPHLRDRGVDPVAARQVARVRNELLRLSRESPRGRSGERVAERSDANALYAPPEEDELLKLVMLAYPDRLARRRGADPNAGVMVGGAGVRLAAESAVKQAEFFVAVDARHDERSPTREALVRIASAVREEWIEQMFPLSVRRERTLVYDEQRQRVVAHGTVWYRDLLLREDRDAAVDSDQASEVLAEALRDRAPEIFGADPAAASLLARVAMLRQWMPEHPWPAFDASQLGEQLAQGAAGKRKLDELRGQDLVHLLQSKLPYPLDRLLEQHAPESIAVPSGSRVKLTYEPGRPPLLAVRLQELFGWTDTPRLAGGRVAVVLHLLGPNYRPVQITDDLRSFWSSTYFQVRKDLRTRYPKHSWPDDPLTAKPEAKGRRR